MGMIVYVNVVILIIDISIHMKKWKHVVVSIVSVIYLGKKN